MAALSLSACSSDPADAPVSVSTPSVTVPASGTGADDGQAHDVEENYGVPVVTWDQWAEKDARNQAWSAMNLFARPDVPAGTWFKELGPRLSPGYAKDAQFIDPARIPIRKITDGPALSRESGNPLTVTATFTTDAGRWRMLLHRTGQHQPWLVASITPEDPDHDEKP